MHLTQLQIKIIYLEQLKKQLKSQVLLKLQSVGMLFNSH
jgi:hypothetical protein